MATIAGAMSHHIIAGLLKNTVSFAITITIAVAVICLNRLDCIKFILSSSVLGYGLGRAGASVYDFHALVCVRSYEPVVRVESVRLEKFLLSDGRVLSVLHSACTSSTLSSATMCTQLAFNS